MKWAASLCAVVIVLALVAWGLFRALTHEARVAARGWADEVFSVLQLRPQVTVKHTVLVRQAQAILEVATETQTLVVETDLAQTFLGSTKRLHLRGQFVVKAGFDLQQDFRVMMTDDGRTARADFPAAKILSVELQHHEVLADENGWWNYLTPDDRAQALANLLAQARREAAASGVLEKAQASLTAQLQKLAMTRGGRWEIHFRGPPSEPSEPQP